MTEALSEYMVLAKLPQPPASISQSGYSAIREWNDKHALKATTDLYNAIASNIMAHFPTELTPPTEALIIQIKNEELASVFLRTSQAGYNALKKIQNVAAVMLKKSPRSYCVG